MAANGNREVNFETRNHLNRGEGGERVGGQGGGEREMGYLERVVFHQMALYADEEDDSLEIKRKKRMARTAMTMWKEDLKECENHRLQHKSEMRRMMNEVYQLVSLYSVFVGVVLTAVATSSRLECQHLWSPVSLSLFGYSMIIAIAFKKFTYIRMIEENLESVVCIFKEITKIIVNLKRCGYADFDFESACRVREGVPQPRLLVKCPYWKYVLGLLIPLTIFTAGVEISLVHILCWS